MMSFNNQKTKNNKKQTKMKLFKKISLIFKLSNQRINLISLKQKLFNHKIITKMKLFKKIRLKQKKMLIYKIKMISLNKKIL